ncbi:hypothetical protein BJV82DRAFT_634051 [Fennellomyces sp. T-0311]|nr:hypothetical protein BJV82DRAFT_634051 [Fennellomyces sp. T-0311]
MSGRTLPLEIIDHVLSFVDYLELYRIRQTSRTWQQLSEQHIYDKTRCDPIIFAAAHYVNQELPLVAHSFDTVNKIIEFRPRKDEMLIAKDDTFPPSIFRRMVKLFFEPWKDVPMPAGLPPKYNGLVPSQRHYNPALEQCYMLSAASSIHSTEYEPHLIAKKGMVLSFSYVHRKDILQQRRELERRITAGADGGQLPVNQGGYPESVTATPWLPRTCGIQIHWMKASLAWIMSGFHPYVEVPPLYTERYDQLQTILNDKYRIFRYDPFSETVTRYILEDTRSIDGGTLPNGLLNYFHTYSEDDDASIEAKLSQVERALEQENIDPRVLWKYRSVHYGIVTNFAPGNSRDAIISRILAAEKRLLEEKQRIIKEYTLPK